MYVYELNDDELVYSYSNIKRLVNTLNQSIERVQDKLFPRATAYDKIPSGSTNPEYDPKADLIDLSANLQEMRNLYYQQYKLLYHMIIIKGINVKTYRIKRTNISTSVFENCTKKDNMASKLIKKVH